MTIRTDSRTDAQSRGIVRAESLYPTTVEDLWSACTAPERTARWIARVEGELREGGIVHLCYSSSWSGPVRIESCEPPHHLLLVGEPGTPQAGETELWLTAEGDHTRLVVEERGLDPNEVHFHVAGWYAHLEDLATYLSTGNAVHPEGWSSERPADDWYRRFAERAGIDGPTR